MQAPPNIHIVGMYKSGTSWLLHILAAHPEILAFREFDVILATHERKIRSVRERMRNLLNRRLNRFQLLTEHPEHIPKDHASAVRDIFLGRGLVPISDESKRHSAMNLVADTGTALTESLAELAGKKLQRPQYPDFDPKNFDNTLGFANFRHQDFAQFIDQVLATTSVPEIPKLYYEFVQSQCTAGSTIAFKAADQILSLDLLNRYDTTARKIAIIRDGRDAAVSALHYEALMRQEDSPWQTDDTGLWSRMTAWSSRINHLLEYADHNPIKILRYEDLYAAPDRVIADVFSWLGVAASESVVAEVIAKTRFETVSGGRAAGEEANSIFRKGMPGDWQDKLSPSEAKKVWRRLGPQLERLGYGPAGEITAPTAANIG